MAAESVKQRMSSMTSQKDNDQLRILLQAQYDALVAVIAQMGAKLDADAGVTDTNYAALAAASIATKIVA